MADACVPTDAGSPQASMLTDYVNLSLPLIRWLDAADEDLHHGSKGHKELMEEKSYWESTYGAVVELGTVMQPQLEENTAGEIKMQVDEIKERWNSVGNKSVRLVVDLDNSDGKPRYVSRIFLRDGGAPPRGATSDDDARTFSEGARASAMTMESSALNEIDCVVHRMGYAESGLEESSNADTSTLRKRAKRVTIEGGPSDGNASLEREGEGKAKHVKRTKKTVTHAKESVEEKDHIRTAPTDKTGKVVYRGYTHTGQTPPPPESAIEIAPPVAQPHIEPIRPVSTAYINDSELVEVPFTSKLTESVDCGSTQVLAHEQQIEHITPSEAVAGLTAAEWKGAAVAQLTAKEDKRARKEAEKAVRDAEKLAEKEEKKLRKESEKLAKEAEKHAKDEARLIEKEARDAERAVKDAEKAARDAEKQAEKEVRETREAAEKAARDADKAAENAAKESDKAATRQTETLLQASANEVQSAEKSSNSLEKEAEKAAKAADKEAEKAVKAAEKEAKALQKEADKAAKAAEKELEKEAKAAQKEAKEVEKEAERAVKEAEKDAEKTAKAAEKEAEKAAKTAEKEAEKAAKAVEKEALKLQKEAEDARKSVEHETERFVTESKSVPGHGDVFDDLRAQQESEMQMKHSALKFERLPDEAGHRTSADVELDANAEFLRQYEQSSPFAHMPYGTALLGGATTATTTDECVTESAKESVRFRSDVKDNEAPRKVTSYDDGRKISTPYMVEEASEDETEDDTNRGDRALAVLVDRTKSMRTDDLDDVLPARLRIYVDILEEMVTTAEQETKTHRRSQVVDTCENVDQCQHVLRKDRRLLSDFMDCWITRIDARDMCAALEKREEGGDRALEERLKHVEYRMDTLRDSLYKRFVARESQVRRLKRMSESCDELGEKVETMLSINSPDEWHRVQRTGNEVQAHGEMANAMEAEFRRTESADWLAPVEHIQERCSQWAVVLQEKVCSHKRALGMPTEEGSIRERFHRLTTFANELKAMPPIEYDGTTAQRPISEQPWSTHSQHSPLAGGCEGGSLAYTHKHMHVN